MSKIVLVTGTSRGIGKDLAERFLAAGHIVYGCSRGKSSISNDRYTHLELDVCQEESVVKAVRSISRTHGKIDWLVNNAGLASMNHLLTTPVGSARSLLEVNCLGTFLFVREVAKVMSRTKFGRIINVSSVAVRFQIEGEAMYAASKAAVEAFSKIASRELAPFGITVNVIAPGPIRTDLIAGVPSAKIERIIDRQSIKRYCEFDDFFNTVEFFLSDKSSFITGQVITLGTC